MPGPNVLGGQARGEACCFRPGVEGLGFRVWGLGFEV